MILPNLIQKKLTIIRDSLNALSSGTMIYETDFIEKTMDQLDTLLHTSGIQQSTIVPVNGNDVVSREHLLQIQREFVQFANDMNTSLRDSGLALNTILERITQEINRITALMDNLETSTNDLERKVLEAAVDKSIYDSEVKVIDFKRTYITSNIRITDDNTVTLPVIARQSFQLSNMQMHITKPNNLDKPLVPSIDNILGVPDARLPEGYWIGNLIGNTSDTLSRLTLDNLYDVLGASNAEFNIQTINHELSPVEITLIGTLGSTINEVVLKTNTMNEFFVNDTKVALTNDSVFLRLDPGQVKIKMTQNTPTDVQYDRISISPIASQNRNDRTICNAVESAAYLARAVDGDLSALRSALYDLTGVTGNGTSASSRYDVITDVGTMAIFVTQIRGIELATARYGLSGQWESDIITTDKRIRAIELDDQVTIPEETHEYVSYQVSFDRNTWYDIRSSAKAPTETNRQKPTRLEINTNSTRNDYLVIKDPTPHYGLYLRVFLSSASPDHTPTLRNLKLRVKVEDQ